MNFNFQLFIWLFFAFIIATIIGTLSHEFGHYVVAKWLGFEADIHYGSTSIRSDKVATKSDHILITAGGITQTLLVGIIGLFFLFRTRKSFNGSKLTLIQWLCVFLSLFWLRQPANFIGWLIKKLNGKYSSGGDEGQLAYLFGWPSMSIIIPTAFIGLIILCIISFKVVPLSQRLTFWIAGLIGGFTGYILWLWLIGKIIVP